MNFFTRKNSLNLKNVIIFIILVALLSSCTKDVAVHENLPPLRKLKIVDDIDENEFRPISSSAQQVKEFNAKFRVLELHDLALGLENRTDEDGKLLSITNLADKIFDQKFLAEPGLFNSEAFNLFFDFNTQLLSGLAQSKNKEKYIDFLSRYVGVISHQCDENLRHCKNVKFFKQVGNTKDIILAEIKFKELRDCSGISDNSYLNKIRLSYAFSRYGVDDPRVDFYFLKCSISQLSRFDNEQITDSAKSKKMLDLQDDINSLILKSESVTWTDELKEIWSEFQEEIKPASYLFSSEPTNLLEKIIKKIQHSLLNVNSNQINDPEFVKRIDESNEKIAEQYGYSRMIKYFHDEGTDVLNNLSIKPIIARDAAFSIIESVATKRWDPSLGIAYFEKLKAKDHPRLENLIKNYVQVMFLKEIVESNSEMGKFYRESKIETVEVIQQAIQKSQSMSKNWAEFYSRVELLRELAGAVLQIPGDKMFSMGLDLRGLTLSSFYMISFPHMLMLSYYLAEKKFEIVIETMFGKFRADYVDVIELAFSGYHFPWFAYTPGNSIYRNDAYFNTYQILQSLYFAFRTETFRVFGVNEEQFLKKAIDTLLINQQTLVDDGIRVHEESLRGYQKEYSEIINVCSEERKRRLFQSQGEQYKTQYKAEIDFDDLGAGVLSKASWFKAQIGDPKRPSYAQDLKSPLLKSDIMGLHLFNPQMIERLDIIRLNTNHVERYIGMMLDIYKKYRKDKGDSDEQIAKKVNYVSGALKSLDHSKRRFFTMINKATSEIIIDCTLLTLLRENRLHNQLHWAGVEHLRKVYRDKISVLSGDSKYEDVIKKYRFSGYSDEGYEGYDDFSGNVYRLTKQDAHMRIPQFLAGIDSNFKVVMPDPGQLKNASVFSNTTTYVDVPFYDFSGNLLSEQQFVEIGMALTHNRESKPLTVFYPWEYQFSNNILEAVNSNLLPYYALLYRLGKVEVYPDKPECLTQNPGATENCPISSIQLMDPKTLLQENSDLAYLVSVKEEEEELYKLMGYGSKSDLSFVMRTMAGTGIGLYDPSTEGTLLNTKTGSPTGFFDFSYYMSSAPIMGRMARAPWRPSYDESEIHSRYDPMRLTIRHYLKDYYNSKVAINFIPFSQDKYTMDKLDSVQKELFAQDVKFTRDVKKQIEQVEKDDQNREHLDFQGKRKKFVRHYRRSLFENAYYGPYLTQKYANDFDTETKKFETDTNHFFTEE